MTFIKYPQSQNIRTSKSNNKCINNTWIHDETTELTGFSAVRNDNCLYGRIKCTVYSKKGYINVSILLNEQQLLMAHRYKTHISGHIHYSPLLLVKIKHTIIVLSKYQRLIYIIYYLSTCSAGVK